MILPPWQRVDFDLSKDATNRSKHGISLHRAADVDPATVMIERDLRRDYGEERFRLTGVLDKRLHVMIVAPRGDAMRIISLRRANAREVRRHEQAR